VLGRYQIGDDIGSGGMATVYRARDPQLRRDVAVKVMFPHLAKKPEVARRFQREARAAAGLEHPNILRVYDVGGGRVGDDLPDEPPYIVMELVRGQSLRELGEATGPMMAEVVACIGAVLCDALAVAHAAGVIHRDVKPGNVMATDDGRLLLADFGVARIEDDDSLVTRTGALLGTPSFMSPEQAHGADVDGRSDLYSVGATLYQLATGSAPFSGSTAVIIAAITRGEYTAPLRRRPQIGADLARAIQKLMHKEQAGRPKDAAEAAAALRAIAKDSGFGEARDELAAYLKDPTAFEAARRPALVARLVVRAREAVDGKAIPRAIALVDRILALEPDHAEAQALEARIQAGDRRRRAGIAAVLAGCVAAVGAGGYLLLNLPSTSTAPFDSGPSDARSGRADGGLSDAGRADAGTTPPLVLSDARAPASAESKDAGPRISKRKPDAAPIPEVVPVDAAPAPKPPPDAAPPKPAEKGTISVSFDAWCDLSIDGDDLGRASAKKKYPVEPGEHTVVCTQGKGLPTVTKTVTVAAGGHETVKGTLLSTVRVTVGTTDSVRIAGTTYARGAHLDLKPGKVRVELLKGGAVVDTAYVDVPRVAGCTLKDDFQCYP
jgi:serine/threonine-protein kinase